MGTYLMIIESRCRESQREEEFNRWYDSVHVPDIMNEPGTVSVSRWIDDGGDGPVYFALVEIQTDDIDLTLKHQAENAARLAAHHRLSDLFVPVSRRIIRKIGS